MAVYNAKLASIVVMVCLVQGLEAFTGFVRFGTLGNTHHFDGAAGRLRMRQSFQTFRPNMNLQFRRLTQTTTPNAVRSAIIFPRSRALPHSLALKSGVAPEGTPKPFSIVPFFILFGIFNRILYRMQLVPMKEYTYFISQFISICYVLCYGTILLFRKKAGIVTKQMLDFARSNWFVFAGIGLLEALCFLVALYSAARIPGSLLVVLGQAGMIWTVMFSSIILGKRFDSKQLAGVAVVLAGTLFCTLPQATAAAAQTLSSSPSLLAGSMLLYFLSTAFSSLAFILKERVFSKADLDIFVVSSCGSAAQCAFTLLLLPLTFTLATKLAPAEFLRNGWAAFTGSTHACMPWLACAYVAANLSVNIAGITLLKRGGAVSTTIAGAAMVPLVGLAFCLQLPLLGAAPFRWSFVGGLAAVAAGSLLYNHRALRAPPPAAPPSEAPAPATTDT